MCAVRSSAERSAKMAFRKGLRRIITLFLPRCIDTGPAIGAWGHVDAPAKGGEGGGVDGR